MAGATPPKAPQASPGGKNTAYTMQRRLVSAKSHEFDVISNFDKEGYRNREDITILPPGVLVIGSYNVLTNVYGRIGVTKGYTLDGQANSTLDNIKSSYDFTKLTAEDTHVRTWSQNFQYRYVNPVTNVTTWNTLFNTLVANNDVNYSSYWDITQLSNCLLFVNGTSGIWRWSGAITSFASATSTTITKQGSTSFDQAGFDAPGVGSLSYTLASGSFVIGETITGSTSGATGVIEQNTGNIIVIDTITGSFDGGETITGGTSGATGTVITYYPPTSLQVVIDGITYTYTGGDSTNTLTGVSPNPTLGGHVAGTAIAQEATFTANSALTVIPPDFINDLIGNLDNQIFIGSKTSAQVYTSHVNNYLDYSNSSPRLQGEGATNTLAGYPTAFVNQEDNLYVSAGKDLWYETQLNATTNTTTIGSTAVSIIYETLNYMQLKTTALQAAQSQSAVTKIKNDIVFLSFEPIINSLGRVTNILISPQVTDLSYSIVNDMNRYDFTDAAMIYYRQFLYVSVPKEGLIRIYNMTQPKIQYWEAPITFPIARFSIINDELYGHGYSVPETYKLFDGYTFNGHPIPAAAYFSYNNFGTRAYPKDFNLFYLEGYITSNCTLNYTLNYDIDGCQTSRSYVIDGSNNQIVCNTLPDASLGKAPLGSRPLSGFTIPPMSVYSTDTGLPPKFRAIKQLSKFPFYELQVAFTSLGSDQQWEILAFGPAQGAATEGNNSRQY